MTSYQGFGSDRSGEGFEPDGPRGWSPLAVALIATLVLLLGLGGALFGIYVANTNAAARPSPTLTPPLATAGPTLTPTPAQVTATAPATTPAPPDAFALPDLEGTDFHAARTAVRELRLGWRLIFESGGEDPTVRTTEPPAGTMVTKGATIKIFVKGAAPPATVPGVLGLPCGQAASIVIDQGLYPTYPSGRDGVVTSQAPNSSDPQTLHWNDEVTLSCG